MQLRTDADPNELQWADPSVATDYTSGSIIYASLDRDKGSYLEMTLTSNGTLVGSGNDGGYIWASATWTEVGNIANVQDAGDYFKLGIDKPSDLQIEIPYSDILGPPWLLVDGSNVTAQTKAAVQGANEAKTLTQQFRVDVSNVDYYIANTPASGGQLATMRIRLPSSAANTQIDDDFTRLLLPRAWVRVGNFTVGITSNATRSIIGTSLTFTFNYNIIQGTFPTGSTPQDVTVVGEDVHRGEIGIWAFNTESWLDIPTGTPAIGDPIIFYDVSAGAVRRTQFPALGKGELIATTADITAQGALTSAPTRSTFATNNNYDATNSGGVGAPDDRFTAGIRGILCEAYSVSGGVETLRTECILPWGTQSNATLRVSTGGNRVQVVGGWNEINHWYINPNCPDYTAGNTYRIKYYEWWG